MPFAGEAEWDSVSKFALRYQQGIFEKDPAWDVE
jgi:hypothetical protein